MFTPGGFSRRIPGLVASSPLIALFKSSPFVAWFRAAAPYIHAFRGKTFVIAFPGELLESDRLVAFVHDINLLKSLGVRLVLVHGCRAQAELRLQELGHHRSKFHNGLRVTDSATLMAVKEANGVVRADIEALLSMGVANSPMAGADIRVASGNMVTAKPIGVVDGVDMMHTGLVRKIDADQIGRMLDDGDIVLLSPLGYSPTGEIFNLAMEDVATHAAIALHSDKLVFMVDGPGVLNGRGKLLAELTAKEAVTLQKKTEQPSDVARFLPHVIQACEAQVARCHLIDLNIDGALLLEFFTREGVGSMITRDVVERLRPATIADVGGILQLIEPLEAEGILLKRSRELLEMEIANFSVLEYDGEIMGCVALYPFREERAGELACLAVGTTHRNLGRGEQLLQHVEEQAKSKGLRQLFALSTRTAHWFVERGFAETDVSALPKEKKQLYNFQRRSKVFVKNLGR